MLSSESDVSYTCMCLSGKGEGKVGRKRGVSLLSKVGERPMHVHSCPPSSPTSFFCYSSFPALSLPFLSHLPLLLAPFLGHSHKNETRRSAVRAKLDMVRRTSKFKYKNVHNFAIMQHYPLPPYIRTAAKCHGCMHGLRKTSVLFKLCLATPAGEAT